MKLRSFVRRQLLRAHQWLQPKPTNPDPTINLTLTPTDSADDEARRAYIERCHELIEARSLAGAGPWHTPERARQMQQGGPLALAESTNAILSQGAYGDIELALSNVEWRREVNLSWLEFSRWGIQQIILISRLYYIKNPIMRRIIDVCAAYVFARGVDVSSPDEAANEVLKEFFERNRRVLGQLALVDLERKKDYDGNLFFCLFPDSMNSGKVTVRMIDATEMQDIVSNPDDSDDPRYYRRLWTQIQFDERTGASISKTAEAWYPALGYDPEDKPKNFNQIEVMWDSPVYHRKCGTVGKWSFGCPRVYPAIDWSKAAKNYLENCATIARSLAQFALKVTSKGGQQALQGLKQQLQTTVNASGGSAWDQNPPATAGAVFASGPGTEMDAFVQRGKGADPEEVRQFKLMCCMVKGIPETFLADVSTGNLATATSLDRPTETAFLELQEGWVEDLGVIAQYVLNIDAMAPGGKLIESWGAKRKPRVQMMERIRDEHGRSHYRPLSEAERSKRNVIEVRVEFPAIREGDIPQLVDATVAAIGAGLDQKEGVRKLGDLLGIPDNDTVIEEMFPDVGYVRDQTIEEPEPTDPDGDEEDVEESDKLLTAARLIEAAAGKL